MPKPVAIYELGEAFYVPHFEVKVAGRGLPKDIVQDVMQVTYRDNIEGIDSFDLMVNNWNAQLARPKYEPASEARYAGIFDPGQRLELWMGYLGNIRLMLSGEITTLEPNFPESGGPTLSVRGLNVLHSFRTEQHTFSWDRKRDSDIAVDLGRRPPRRGEPGLGIRVVTQPPPDEPEEEYVFMNNQYDIVFLMNRARRHGYVLELREEEHNGQAERSLYFGPSENRSEVPYYKLEWGRSMISFRPTLTTTNQISEVVVRGWDRRRNRPIEESSKWQDLYPSGSPERARMERLAQAFGSRREIITDRPVHTPAEAKALAKDIMSHQLKEMVQAAGATVGLPDLRAGRKVQILGLGARFEGEYFVTETTQTIGPNGYRTEFKARREPRQ